MAISYPRYHVNTIKCWGNIIREMMVLKITWGKIREHGLGHFGTFGKVEGMRKREIEARNLMKSNIVEKFYDVNEKRLQMSILSTMKHTTCMKNCSWMKLITYM
jgi:hypothetical protein